MNNDIYRQTYEVIQETSRQQHKDFYAENQILYLSLQDPDADPRVIAERFSEQYGEYNGDSMLGKDVIQMYRRCRLVPESERRNIFRKAIQAAEWVNASLQNKTNALPDLNLSSQKKRLALLALIDRNAFFQQNDILNMIMRLNKDFSAECMDGIIEIIHTAEKVPEDRQQQEIENLRARLKRTDNLLRNLQESFEEQLLESSYEEREKFFSMLNSERYGHILDLLAASQNGFRQMRKEKKPVPFELRNIQTLVRRFLEFTRDYGVTPLQETGTQLKLSVKDVADYQFEGTPFENETEEKLVKIVSPGWVIQERNITIALPRVREIKKEDE